jgi:hypothetical protein
MAHGYLRDWNEGWGRNDERDGEDRDFRSHERDRDWSDRDRSSAFNFGDRDHRYGRDEDRWDESRSRSDWQPAPRNFSSRQDDHYLSWRDRQMDALDRDYADYCREREQQFHQDFNEWRRQRSGNPQPLRTGMTQTGMSHDPSGEFQLTTESIVGPVEPDAVSDATLGTNSAEGPSTGRSRAKPTV